MFGSLGTGLKIIPLESVISPGSFSFVRFAIGVVVGVTDGVCVIGGGL